MGSTDSLLTIADPAEGATVTIGAAVDPYGDDWFVDYQVELTGNGLRASSSVRDEQDGNSLPTFLDNLAASWRGWEGERVWESIEHDLHITARHDGAGHVTLRFGLRENFGARAWGASVYVRVDAGEDMKALAQSVRAQVTIRP